MRISKHLMFIVLVLTGGGLLSCVTETRETGALAWVEKAAENQEKEAAAAAAPVRPKTPPAADKIISIPEEQMREIMAFVNKEQFLIADRVEIDASRVPFQVAMVTVVDPGYVEKVELVSQRDMTSNIILRARSAKPFVERDFPRVRVGDGIDLVAGREIRMRTHSRVDRARPVFLHVRGTGHAVYKDGTTGQRLEKETGTILVAIELVETSPGKYRLTKVVR